MRKIKVGGTYKHFKGGLYKVINVARNSENTEEKFVVYKHVDGESEYDLDQLWIRSLLMFLEEITRDGKTFYRFEEVKAKKEVDWENLKKDLARVRSFRGKRGSLSKFIAEDRYRH